MRHASRLAAPGVAFLVLVAGACSSDDASDVILVGSKEYVLTCTAVKDDLLSPPEKGSYRPAGGGDSTDVSVHAIESLEKEEIIAVTGAPEVLCSGSAHPGAGVAFSSKTDFDTVNSKVSPLAKPN